MRFKWLLYSPKAAIFASLRAHSCMCGNMNALATNARMSAKVWVMGGQVFPGKPLKILSQEVGYYYFKLRINFYLYRPLGIMGL